MFLVLLVVEVMVVTHLMTVQVPLTLFVTTATVISLLTQVTARNPGLTGPYLALVIRMSVEIQKSRCLKPFGGVAKLLWITSRFA